MSKLYPFKFKPLFKNKVWGGNSLASRYNKKPGDLKSVGESWELSALSGNLSVVINGFLAGNNIEELIEVYMSDITGESVYSKFGIEFPLLIKFIETKEDLSIQVHPDDALAKERHNAYGKTEMWYILECEEGSKIYSGFREGVTEEIYKDHLNNGNIIDLLNVETVNPGDVFFTPAGRVHSIGAGIVMIEIQQTSDITYRIYDWDREPEGVEARELHTELALEAIDFGATGTTKIRKEPVLNKTINMVGCKYFDCNIVRFDNIIKKEYYLFDTFVVYICIDGELVIHWNNQSEKIFKGETVLLPAVIEEVRLEPLTETMLIETFINPERTVNTKK
jgi:mannose-6-phosphate isomerase